MRALVQRVSEASVTVNGSVTGKIGTGLLIFLGVKNGDTKVQAEELARRVISLRVFPDEKDKMNRSLVDVCGELLIVPQFTLYGNTKKGNRPSYSEAAKPELAEYLYDYFVDTCRNKAIPVSVGLFQARMEVRLVNQGPVTLMCDSDPP